MGLARDVAPNPRALSDVETAGFVLHAAELKSQHKAAMKKVEESDDVADVMAFSAEASRVEDDFDILTHALRVSGTEKGRALSIHKMTLSADYSLVAVRVRAKAAKGKPLTEKESAKIDELVTELEAKAKQVEELEAKLKEQTAAAALKGNTRASRLGRRGRRGGTKADFESKLARARELLLAGCLT